MKKYLPRCFMRAMAAVKCKNRTALLFLLALCSTTAVYAANCPLPTYVHFDKVSHQWKANDLSSESRPIVNPGKFKLTQVKLSTNHESGDVIKCAYTASNGGDVVLTKAPKPSSIKMSSKAVSEIVPLNKKAWPKGSANNDFLCSPSSFESCAFSVKGETPIKSDDPETPCPTDYHMATARANVDWALDRLSMDPTNSAYRAEAAGASTAYSDALKRQDNFCELPSPSIKEIADAQMIVTQVVEQLLTNPSDTVLRAKAQMALDEYQNLQKRQNRSGKLQDPPSEQITKTRMILDEVTAKLLTDPQNAALQVHYELASREYANILDLHTQSGVLSCPTESEVAKAQTNLSQALERLRANPSNWANLAQAESASITYQNIRHQQLNFCKMRCPSVKEIAEAQTHFTQALERFLANRTDPALRAELEYASDAYYHVLKQKKKFCVTSSAPASSNFLQNRQPPHVLHNRISTTRRRE